MTAISPNHDDFTARLGRIERNLASSRQLLFVGVDEVYSMPRRDRKAKASKARTFLSNLFYPLSMAAAVALGAVSHGIGRVLRFHIQGMPDAKANPDVEMLVQIAVGFVIAMVLGYFLRLHDRTLTTLKSVGVILGLLFFHNAVQVWPHEFAAVTSGNWVNDIVSSTKPNSLNWRGITFVLG